MRRSAAVRCGITLSLLFEHLEEFEPPLRKRLPRDSFALSAKHFT
jgi:hypothetical protein